MTARVLSIGVVGYGYWGPNLVRNFSEMPGAHVSWVVDQDVGRFDLVRRRHPSAKTTTRFEDLLEDPEVDGIVIATPVHTHFELALAALRAGRHVWIEKPMTETPAQAKMLVEEVERQGSVLFVDHTFIYTGAIKRMADVIKSGQLGKCYYYDSIRVNLGLFQRDVNVISDLAVHDFSILDHLLNEHPTAISASGINHFPGTPENLAYVTLFYDSGTIAHINVNWLAPVKVRQTLIGGSQKMIVYDDLEPSEKVKIYDKGVSFTDDLQQIYSMRVGYRTGDMYAPKLDTKEALRTAGEHFIECILSGCRPQTDSRMGLRVVQLIDAATRSMRARGETVPLRAEG